ncbi:unnamed protein product [Thelazia callipaeda]|uniref:Transmembrane protein n=1 Tax=Thelazia callipaeda TaxID=103827 RepID=A0A0N5CKQ5_THECL|nr:unnamed protein product [Thelazia callipaeda]
MLILLLLSMISFTASLLGLALLAIGYGLNLSTIVFLCFGLSGLVTSTVLWTIRPKSLMTWPKCLKRFVRRHRRHTNNGKQSEVLDRDKAEMIMRNIRGIPYLIQAIQYSMETTYYTAMMAQSSGEVPTTSVIHTAPKCTSVIDSDHEDCCSAPETVLTKDRPTAHIVHQTIEEWIPTGSSSWNNTQLRISISNNSDTGINVFPYSEVTPRLSSDPILEMVERPAEISSEIEETKSFLKRLTLLLKLDYQSIPSSTDC